MMDQQNKPTKLKGDIVKACEGCGMKTEPKEREKDDVSLLCLGCTWKKL